MTRTRATLGFFALCSLLFAAGMMTATAVQAQAQILTVASQPAGLQILMQSQLTPIPLNQMHSWIIEIKPENPTLSADELRSAVISLTGGMPAHNHGLATSPQVTEYLGNGQFLLEGVRFHMVGQWTLQLQIQLGQNTYSALLELTL